MKKSPGILSDIIIGLVISLAVTGSYFAGISFFEGLEYKLYDLRAKTRQSKQPNPNISLVVIDETSIANIGRWPWPRSVIAELIDKISEAEPKVIGLNILLTEPDRNQGLEELRFLKQNYTGMMFQLQPKLKSPKDRQLLMDFLLNISSSEVIIDNDTILNDSIQNAGNVVLPMFFVFGKSTTQDPQEILDVISASVIPGPAQSDSGKAQLTEAHSPIVPFDLFAQSAAGIGYSNLLFDSDGVVRSETPVVRNGDKLYPSFTTQLASIYMGITLDKIRVDVSQKKISLGNAVIPLDDKMTMFVDFAGPTRTYSYNSVFDVLTDKIPPEAFKGKIVIIGYMATGLADLNAVPVGNNFPGTEIVANIVGNILDQKFITRPSWASSAEIAMLAICALFITLLLPRLKAKWSSFITLAMLLAISAFGFMVFRSQANWIKILYPSFMLAVGYTVITTKKFLFTEKRKELAESESIETNKMLGLSFQGQGMLDIAFEKFRKCPMDDAVKELLYNLALDFERKRQFNKAIAVYDHIKTVDAKYKDLETRIKMLKDASEGVVTGAGFKKSKGGETVIIEGAATQKPTLGRYEIAKELGHGAMGTVYLGKDPKINRMVAIKTLRFEDDIGEEEMKSIKQRFFREAESAGNLSHPNIIKIYDAGEDYDVSFIAMELLEGRDFKENCEKDKLLPVKDLLNYMIKIADGLDYAHQQGVIHRDIKPANIMLLKDGTLRITDFGIARIMASSKTQTGTVLGTPSYMSPEQISGKKVDGRSDLFSFGVMFYEMLTGEKPFQGDSIATLLFQIANADPRNPKELKTDLPNCISAVVTKLLKKNPDERYQRGSEIVKDLQRCMDVLEGRMTDITAPQPKPAMDTIKIDPGTSQGDNFQMGTIKIDPAPPQGDTIQMGTIKIGSPEDVSGGTIRIAPPDETKKL